MKIIPKLSVLILLFTFLVTGCANKEERVLTEKEIYDRANQHMQAGNFEEAAEKYTELTASYPYGAYTTQGELENCYAHYKIRNSQAAIPCIDNFLRQHPTHPHIDYAYYLKGLASLPIRTPKFGENFFKTQEQFSDHDVTSSLDAYAAFTEVIERFPLSDYAESSRQILIDLINTFARHNLRVARFYLYREAYIGAINRAKVILEQFSKSPHTEEALAILIYAYEKLELPEHAENNRTVLAYNFPESPYLRDPSSVLDPEIMESRDRPVLFGLFN